jgi:alpha-beta hydrolase superfamily lysophospholipase
MMGARQAGLAVAFAAAAGGLALAGAGAVFARRATAIATLREDTLPVVAWHEDSVELAATPATLTPGTFSLYTGQGAGHRRIGRVLARGEGTVTREIEAVYRPGPRGAERGYWSGYGFETPGDLGLGYFELAIPVDRGTAPVWLVGGDPDVWVVHVHGLGGRRAACLRSVPVFRELGATQLVVSYAGDRDAPPLEDGRHHFGLDEWRDVEAALDYAVKSGAKRVVLSVWSMGATIALQLLRHSRHREIIKGLVMTAPVLDWEQTLVEQGRLAGAPAVVARAGSFLMGSRLHRLAGLRRPLDAKAGSWLAGAPDPCPPVLILHAPEDPMASWGQSERFAAAAGAELVSVDAPGHTLEWSVDADGCSGAVRRWWARLP